VSSVAETFLFDPTSARNQARPIKEESPERYVCRNGLTRSQERGISSAGRAPGLQPGGHRFEPGILHQCLAKRLEGRLAAKQMADAVCGPEEKVRTRDSEATSTECSLTTEYPANGSSFRTVYRNGFTPFLGCLSERLSGVPWMVCGMACGR
jgi:hypothetical protein